jgi:hypothetical protein
MLGKGDITMTNEEFLELAKQNNALLSPEETEKCRQETIKLIEQYHLRFDWLGSPYFVDSHDPLQRVADGVHTGICVGGLICFAPLLLLYGGFAIIVLLFLLSMLF